MTKKVKKLSPTRGSGEMNLTINDDCEIFHMLIRAYSPEKKSIFGGAFVERNYWTEVIKIKEYQWGEYTSYEFFLRYGSEVGARGSDMISGLHLPWAVERFRDFAVYQFKPYAKRFYLDFGYEMEGICYERFYHGPEIPNLKF